MKKLLKMCSVIAAALTMCGCVPHTELNEKAIVLAIGIDYENEEYSVTFQYYSPTGIGGRTLVDDSQPNVLTSSGKGSNVYTALEDASFKCGKELLLGVTQLLVIGENAAKDSAEQVIAFSKTCFQNHPDMLITVAEGKAKDFMEVKFKEGIVSTDKLKFMLQNAEAEGFTELPTALELFTAMQTKQKSLCLPRFKLIEDGQSDASEDGKSIEISGGVLLKDGKAAGDVGLDVVSGLQLLKGDAQNTLVTVGEKEERISVELYDIKTDIKPFTDDGRLIFQVTLTAQGRYMDTMTKIPETGGEETEKECAALIIERMKKAAEETVLQYGADAIDLEKTVRHYNYSLWQEAEESWEEMLKGCEFRFSAEVNIDKLSLSSN